MSCERQREGRRGRVGESEVEWRDKGEGMEVNMKEREKWNFQVKMLHTMYTLYMYMYIYVAILLII